MRELWGAACEFLGKLDWYHDDSLYSDLIDRLHRQIMDIGGTKLKAAESKVNLVTSQIDQIMGHITKANVAIKNSKRYEQGLLGPLLNIKIFFPRYGYSHVKDKTI